MGNVLAIMRYPIIKSMQDITNSILILVSLRYCDNCHTVWHSENIKAT